MRVLVTGAGGFAGRHLVAELLEGGAERVVGTVLPGQVPPLDGAVADEAGRLEWRELDITSSPSIRGALRGERFDEVYHLAGQSSVGQSFGDPVDTWEINATGTLRLLTELERSSSGGCRVLVVSSAEVYGDVPLALQPVKEERAPAPVTPYGASKLGAEAVALQAAAARRLEVVIARSFNHAGPGQDRRFIFPSMAMQLVRIAAGGCTYNVCSGESHSLQELVEGLVRISGTGARIEVDPERFRPVDIPELRGDPSRLLALGWEPRIPLERTLLDLYRSAGRELAAAGEPA